MNRELRKLIESGRFDEVEDRWLNEMARDPGAIARFTAIARRLVGAGESERAAMLLELVDEELDRAGRLDERLELLQRAGPLYLAPEKVHARLVDTLGRFYADSPSFAGIAQKVGLDRAPTDLPKAWKKVARLRALLAYELGSVVWMEGKGLGRVVEVNLALDSFKLDLDPAGELRVGFSAAPKLLQSLGPEHFLRRKLEAPEELARLEPGELLERLFASEPRALSAAEIREAMRGLVGEKQWTAWWAAARKHPQLVQAAPGGRAYSWAGDRAEARDAVRSSFADADLKGKLEHFRRSSKGSGALADELAKELGRLAAKAVGDAPEEALAIAVTLERAGRLPADADWSPDRLLASSPHLARWIPRIADRAMRRLALERVTVLREDRTEVLRGALDQETDPALVGWLIEALREASPEAAARFVEDVMARPRQRPAAFVWLAERAASDPDMARRNPLPVLRQVLTAHHDEAFRGLKTRLEELMLAPDGGAGLIGRIEGDRASAALEALERAPQQAAWRQPLIEALTLRFPELRKQEVETLYATAESVTERKRQLRELLEEEIPENRRAIETAREMGDLRENFEYKAARQRHELLTARAEALDRDLRRAQVVDLERVSSDEVRIGARVGLAAEGAERTIVVLGPWESDPEAGVLSYDSDLGRALLGLRTGDEIEIDGGAWTVRSIEPYRSGGEDTGSPSGTGASTTSAP